MPGLFRVLRDRPNPEEYSDPCIPLKLGFENHELERIYQEGEPAARELFEQHRAFGTLDPHALGAWVKEAPEIVRDARLFPNEFLERSFLGLSDEGRAEIARMIKEGYMQFRPKKIEELRSAQLEAQIYLATKQAAEEFSKAHEKRVEPESLGFVLQHQTETGWVVKARFFSPGEDPGQWGPDHLETDPWAVSKSYVETIWTYSYGLMVDRIKACAERLPEERKPIPATEQAAMEISDDEPAEPPNEN